VRVVCGAGCKEACKSSESSVEGEGSRGAGLRMGEEEPGSPTVAPWIEIAALRAEVEQLRSNESRLQEENLRLKSRLSELRQWQDDEGSFEGAVAEAIQIARDADESEAHEIERLRSELDALRGREVWHGEAAGADAEAWAAHAEAWAVERRKLLLEISRLTAKLGAARVSASHTSKDQQSERLRARQTGRELEQSKVSLHAAQKELRRLNEELMSAKQEVVRLSALNMNTHLLRHPDYANRVQMYLNTAARPTDAALSTTATLAASARIAEMMGVPSMGRGGAGGDGPTPSGSLLVDRLQELRASLAGTQLASASALGGSGASVPGSARRGGMEATAPLAADSGAESTRLPDAADAVPARTLPEDLQARQEVLMAQTRFAVEMQSRSERRSRELEAESANATVPMQPRPTSTADDVLPGCQAAAQSSRAQSLTPFTHHSQQKVSETAVKGTAAQAVQAAQLYSASLAASPMSAATQLQLQKAVQASAQVFGHPHATSSHLSPRSPATMHLRSSLGPSTRKMRMRTWSAAAS
jgi:regulator of replication initiation timing